MHPWLPAAHDDERRAMLRRIGVDDPLELYRDVPREIMLAEPPRVGYGRLLSEEEIRRILVSHAQRIKVFRSPPPFMGGGVCVHHVPAALDAILSRGEFYTAYTPYQPEINQGLLQAFFEYQSLMADLLELDVVTLSMYNWSTAAAEAALMAARVTRRQKIVVSSGIHPERLEVLRTWLSLRGLELREIRLDESTRTTRLAEAEKVIDNETAAVYVETPNFYGAAEEDVEALAEKAHRHGALFIVGVEPLSLGLFKPPGSYGADIAVSDAQPLGLGLNYGGPYLGVLAVRAERRLVRQMPGRLVGMTKTVEGGERGFTMILQTREQHIRREKATSNITSNEALLAVAAAAYLTLLGGQGLRSLARSIWLRSHYAAKRLSELPGVEAPCFEAEFFKEFTVRFPRSYQELHQELLRRDILGGLPLSRLGGSELEALFCVTEVHSRRDIDMLVDTLGELI